jgi:hypothetical protein
MVSNIHVARIAVLVQSSLPSLTCGGWGAGCTAVEAMALDIKEIVKSLLTNVVAMLQLFENVTYHTVTTVGTNIPCRKDQQGNEAMDGDLLLAPPEMLAPT